MVPLLLLRATIYRVPPTVRHEPRYGTSRGHGTQRAQPSSARMARTTNQHTTARHASMITAIAVAVTEPPLSGAMSRLTTCANTWIPAPAPAPAARAEASHRP